MQHQSNRQRFTKKGQTESEGRQFSRTAFPAVLPICLKMRSECEINEYSHKNEQTFYKSRNFIFLVP